MRPRCSVRVLDNNYYLTVTWGCPRYRGMAGFELLTIEPAWRRVLHNVYAACDGAAIARTEPHLSDAAVR